MKKTICLISLLVLFFCSKAQDSLRFRAQQWIGHLEGENGSAFQFNTAAGVQLGSNYLGLGSGIDWYYFRSVPVYLTYQRTLPVAKGRFFLNADAGLNYSWKKKNSSNAWSNTISDQFFPSTYAETGIGYRTFFKNKKDALLFHIGFGYKQLKEDKEIPVFCIMAPCPTLIEHYSYKMSRLSIKMGWEF